MVKIISNDSNIVLENKEHKRQLNFEFLRIISMILILLHHYAYHGGLVDIDQIGANKIVGLLINMGGKLGNIIFILISGYFMVDKEFKIKKLLKIIFETIFYSVVILLILLITNNINFSLITNFIYSIWICYSLCWIIYFFYIYQQIYKLYN